MLIDIENALIDKISDSLGSGIATVERYNKIAGSVEKGEITVPLPAVFVLYTGGEIIEEKKRFLINTEWTLLIAAQNLAAQAEGRKEDEIGAYAIITQILNSLTKETLGLQILPLKPTGVFNLYNEALEKYGIALYGLNFKTGFVI